ncbi:hypothetical protein D5H75_31520 [Bailinhaonella thermotolerans]|uniref:DUF6879 domain-containing protein n=1 Tax=Bailinhaonella thermotolerans TaxID=1070861 RepID=A0A3A4ARV4_9ACTN|nr:hypothetical protein D5H75_31520 [Bailinhaonella thermotolerans]
MLARATRSAVHLEMRDFYAPCPGFEDWMAGGDGRTDRSGWVAAVEGAVSRGVRVRRARVVSEPVSDYTRWLYMVTDVNLKAGEEVRWLPRRQAFDLLLPGADFWMFDQRVVLWNFNSGNGEHVEGYEYSSDPRVAAQVVAAFEQVWERATPHEKFEV